MVLRTPECRGPTAPASQFGLWAACLRKTPTNLGDGRGFRYRGCRTGCADAANVGRVGLPNGEGPMGFVLAASGACVLLPLIATAQTAQQDQSMTATASASSKSDACTASTGKAYSLCTARGFFNITGVTCDCNQRNVLGAPWECVATATCKK